YKTLEKVMLSLVLMMLFCFVTTVAVIRPSLSDILSGVKPVVPEGSVGLIVAFIASCFSLVGAFYQAYLVQEKRKTKTADLDSSKYAQLSSTVGILLLGVISMV